MGRNLLQAFMTAAVLVVLYYLLPMDNVSDAGSVAILTLGLIGVVILLGWQLRAVVNAQYPGIRAIQALATTVPLFLLLFASTYYLVERASPASFSQAMSRTDALYFTVTTFSTVGYGDITAKGEGARIVVMLQMLANLAVLGLGVKVLFGAVQQGRERQGRGAGGGGLSAAAPASPGVSRRD